MEGPNEQVAPKHHLRVKRRMGVGVAACIQNQKERLTCLMMVLHSGPLLTRVCCTGITRFGTGNDHEDERGKLEW